MDLGSWFNNVGAEYYKDLIAKLLYLTSGLCNMIGLTQSEDLFDEHT